MRIIRSLRLTKRKRNNEVPVQAAGHPSVHNASRGAVLASTGAKVHVGWCCRRSYEATVLELLDHQERTVRILSDGEMSIERIVRPVVSAGTRVG